MHELPANPHHFRLVINRVPTSFQAPILMTYTRTLVLIPARMASTRLPDKPLLDIAGLPMIVHVLRQAEAAQIGRVAVATDTPEIVAAVTAHGGEAVMTRADHPSGSDRIYEALCKLDPGGQIEAVVNVQGDLPTIPAHDIRAALMLLEDSRVDIGTLVAEIRKDEEHTTPSVVKLIGSPAGNQRLRALYFTRATAPYGDGPRYHHIGLYAYRREALERFVKLPPSVLEQREKLEELRALEAGMRIDAAIVDSVPLGVDTLPDIRRRIGRDHLRRGRPRHDPDRELGRRPRRRHPSSAAGFRPVHRRRMVLADPASADGTTRRKAYRYQVRGEPRPRARAMPPHHPQARRQANCRGRYRRQRARYCRAWRQDRRRDCLTPRGGHLRPRYFG